jgi:hypothetical protein
MPPFYAYLCGEGHSYDRLKSISDRKNDVCDCGVVSNQQITAPAAPIIKGQPGGTAKNLGGPRVRQTRKGGYGVNTATLPVVGRDGNLYSAGGKRIPNE